MTPPKESFIHNCVCWIIGAFVFIVVYIICMEIMNAWDKAEREYQRSKLERFYQTRWLVIR